MNTLITLYTTAWGGAEESVLDLAREIANKGVETTVLWISNYEPHQHLLSGGNFKLICLQLSPKVYSFLAPVLVAYLCIRYRIQIVNLNWRFVKEESRYLKYLRVRTVATVRAILFDKDNCREFDNTDAVIGVSEAVTHRMKEIGYRHPLFTIYNGINVSRLKTFNPSNYHPTLILSMSRLVAWKRIDWTIKAVNKLRRKGIPLILDIYGEGSEWDNLNNLIKSLQASSYIKLRDYIDNNSSKLSKYGIFVIPSFKEPFGRTIVENVLRERVLVGSKSGGIPELLPDYPLLFQYQNFSDYVKKIELAYKNYPQYQRLIQSYKSHFKGKFNMARVADDYIKVYNRLCKNVI